MNAENSRHAIDLYLDLLKKSLTGTLFKKEPEVGQENEQQFIHEFIQHYIKGTSVSMLPLSRLDNVHFCIDRLVARTAASASNGTAKGGRVDWC